MWSLFGPLTFALSMQGHRTIGSVRSIAPSMQEVATLATDFQEAAVALCERRLQGHDVSLAAVPAMLQRLCDEDFESMLARSRRTLLANVTCLCPSDGTTGDQIFGDELIQFRALHTQPGRQCRDGSCGSACSRVTFTEFATADECATLREHAERLMSRCCGIDVGDEEMNVDLGSCAREGDVRATLLFLRLTERLRRCVAHEYVLPVRSVRASYGFVSRIPASTHEPTPGLVHADESSDSSYHYSA